MKLSPGTLIRLADGRRMTVLRVETSDGILVVYWARAAVELKAVAA